MQDAIGINPFSNKWDFRYRVAHTLLRMKLVANIQCLIRIGGAPLLGAAIYYTMIAPPETQALLGTMTVLYATPLWLTDLFDGPTAMIGQFRYLAEKSPPVPFKYTNEDGNTCFRTEPQHSLAQERRLPLLDRIFMERVTHLGETIDPLADKLMFAAVQLPLVHEYTWAFGPAILGVATEVALFLIRPLKNYLKINKKAANMVGKYKVHVQWVSQLILLVIVVLKNMQIILLSNWLFQMVGVVGMSAAAVMSLFSLIAHVRSIVDHYKLKTA